MKPKNKLHLLLEELKSMGFDRRQIEKDLDYAPKYLDQQVSRWQDGNIENPSLYNTLIKYRESQKAYKGLDQVIVSDLIRIRAYNKVLVMMLSEVLANQYPSGGDPATVLSDWQGKLNELVEQLSKERMM